MLRHGTPKAESTHERNGNLGEETIGEVNLPFLQTLRAERHLTQSGYHVLRIAEGKMTQETLVVLVYLVFQTGINGSLLLADVLAEAGHDFLEERFVEDQVAAMHHLHHVVALKEVPRLENDAVGTSVEYINPEALVQDFSGKDENLHVGKASAQLSADIHPYRCAASESEVEQNEVGLTVAHQFPEVGFALSGADNLCLRHFGLQDLLGAFEFQFVVLDDDYFEFFHIFRFYHYQCVASGSEKTILHPCSVFSAKRRSP